MGIGPAQGFWRRPDRILARIRIRLHSRSKWMDGRAICLWGRLPPRFCDDGVDPSHFSQSTPLFWASRHSLVMDSFYALTNQWDSQSGDLCFRSHGRPGFGHRITLDRENHPQLRYGLVLEKRFPFSILSSPSGRICYLVDRFLLHDDPQPCARVDGFHLADDVVPQNLSPICKGPHGNLQDIFGSLPITSRSQESPLPS
mmetsp:Transcript_26819/g.63039  ORF Transcript_26819/g.63039 Transcript_26819/m.63039 type:complete len:200 (-) Transcript_26819:330-929(-)